LADLVGIEVSPGWVHTACRRAQRAVAPASEAIKDALAVEPVVYFDESVSRVECRNHWLHVATTPRLTAYHIDAHGRSAKSIIEFGILPRFTGVAVHDAYSAYDQFTDATHALCNQHIIAGVDRDRRVRSGRPGGRLDRGGDQPARGCPPLGRSVAP
jgi:transposase